ncbi:hypothetical protein NLG97_g4419 [Lecanicillium saksenae]|uniref:Uncharacterized protein n=1 Tax=Lecanicillium saksenae TaxID=468837 RepID=A0ACC1QVC2_9HYPO|nr:hypothetical protein NLG97_g4419 [Lecanicillium saksenae]
MISPVTFLALTCLSTTVLGTSLTRPSQQNAPEFDWDSIKPSPKLVYHDCYEQFKCARLEVPLDWHNPSDPRRAIIAIQTLPARVPTNHSSFAGSILTNPGGPGNSGTQIGLAGAAPMQALFDKPGERHYEIVWFDPRGIGRTTPAASCFRSNLARAGWFTENQGMGGINGLGHGGLNAGDMGYALALNKGFALACKQTEGQYGEALAYVNTASVARDMVEIIDRSDELYNGHSCGSGYNLDRRHENKTEVPRLKFLGFSYGTTLGNYFASMFPGRVSRLILDGVLDADDYANGPGWTTNLVDTDKIFDEFWEGCFAAGPKLCHLADGTDPVSAQRKFWSWVASIDEGPLAFVDASGIVNIFSGDDMRRYVGLAVYHPLEKFADLHRLAAGALKGDESAIVEMFNASSIKPPFQNGYPASGSGAPEGRYQPGPLEGEPAYVCGDGSDVTDKDAPWWMDYFRQQEKQSRVLGRYWPYTRLICSSWPVKANWRFTGPFTSPAADPSNKPGVPLAPILFLSTRLDPVTPVSAARRMAAGHPGAGIVVPERHRPLRSRLGPEPLHACPSGRVHGYRQGT